MTRSISFMRNAFLYASVALVLMTASSCTKTVVQPTQSIYYSYTVNSGGWTFLPATSSFPAVWDYHVSVPGLTANILNYYAVLVYYTQSNTQTLLPFTLEGIDYYYSTSPGSLDVQVAASGTYQNFDPSTPGAGQNDPVYLKVIVIPQ
jgi:hypothetical protein